MKQTPCEACNRLFEVPFVLIRQKRVDGSFSAPQVLSVTFCPVCGQRVSTKREDRILRVNDRKGNKREL